MLTAAQRAAVLFHAMPAEDRGETIEAFAATIGVTTRTLERWKAENREYVQALDKARKAYQTSPDFYALCVRRRALALINDGLAMRIGQGPGCLSSSERRQYIAAALAETKQVADSLDTIDRTHLSDHELVAEMMARGIGDGVPALFECVDILKGESECSKSSVAPSAPSSESFAAVSATGPAALTAPKLAKTVKKTQKPRKKHGATTGKGHPGLITPPKAST